MVKIVVADLSLQDLICTFANKRTLTRILQHNGYIFKSLAFPLVNEPENKGHIFISYVKVNYK